MYSETTLHSDNKSISSIAHTENLKKWLLRGTIFVRVHICYAYDANSLFSLCVYSRIWCQQLYFHYYIWDFLSEYTRLIRRNTPHPQHLIECWTIFREIILAKHMTHRHLFSHPNRFAIYQQDMYAIAYMRVISITNHRYLIYMLSD